MQYLTNRLYATIILDNRIARTEYMLRAYQALPFDLGQSESVDVGQKIINFKHKMAIKEVEDFVDIFQLDVFLTWSERDRMIQVSRSAYIADFDTMDDQKK